ncbi:MAG: methanogenesis marker 16 metalloprotein [Methanosarcinales archaeon]|jgi:putative methanogenesis marker 16 metalloprotein|nr:methanogenesis marker 16 metalloprotein [Methanosarcinales archaeon]
MSAAENGRAIRVMTAAELKDRIRRGNPPAFGEVDAVTCGTFGVMSGTMAVLSFQAAEAGVFEKAVSVTINGVPAAVGPCPNENNGFIDLIVLGTSVSKKNEKYGGGHLFKDLVSRRKTEAEIQTSSGFLTKELTLDEMNTARLIVTRGSFKNYSAFANAAASPVLTIFSVLPLQGNCAEITVSGCGEINPAQNDPSLRHHRPGTRVLVNGAEGVLLGTGTRSSNEKPNLSAAADMFCMDPDLMGGFVTSKGAECLTSFATVIPVSDEETFAALQITDAGIPLPVMDVSSRRPVSDTVYADVWQGTDLEITVLKEKCVRCEECVASRTCPAGALETPFMISKNCVSCLTCTVSCESGVYSANGGTVLIDGKNAPIHLRQSDRRRGEKAASLLKSKIESGEWVI